MVGLIAGAMTTGENILFEAFKPHSLSGGGVLVDILQRIVGGAPLIGPASLAPMAGPCSPPTAPLPSGKRTGQAAHQQVLSP